MIDDGMPVVAITIAGGPAGGLVEPPNRREKSLFTVDGIGKLLLVGSVLVLLLPAMIIVSAVAILVPCFLRVPVCGTSGR